MRYIRLSDLNLAEHVRPRDRVVCGQGTSEPCSLTELLVRDAPAIGAFDVFVGAVFSSTFRAEMEAAVGFHSYGAIGGASELARRGLLDVIPCHYSALYEDFDQGVQVVDVVLIQLCGNETTGFNLGLANDYVARAAAGARTVIAEINPQIPWTQGAELPADIRIVIAVEVDRKLLELVPAALGEVEQRIASKVASLTPDGAVLQLGVGAIPDAVLSGLQEHNDLGIHSGVISDRPLTPIHWRCWRN